MNTRDLQMPDGSEREIATPVHELGETRLTVPGSLGSRGRLDALKSRGMSKAHEVRRAVDHRTAVMKSSIRSAKRSVREGAKVQVARMESSMRTSPMKWAGIAAGTGFGLGLIGRIAQAKSKRHHVTDIIIIEASV